ncbi:helix-turn-helix domain-containing protein [Mycobacterium sp.]|uniref:helix-turn-helix domain-containing protein n=1 Tax=Mycobacterium sp. TaxID=1785 RepID=UPI003F95A7F4
MAKKGMESGPMGKAVIENMTRIRKHRGFTLNQLSERTEESGRKLSVSALSLIATGKRRVDADDLWTLAVALETTVHDLMGITSAAKPLSPAAQQIVDLVTLLDFKGDLGGKNWDSKGAYEEKAPG